MLLLLAGVLSVALSGEIQSDSRPNSTASAAPLTTGTCGYESCPATKPGYINIHIISHTHDDVGWVHTVDFYYEYFVKSILDTVVQQLRANPDRRFIYVEMAFFTKWWSEQDQFVQGIVRELIQSGRLEFISGGWSMNDEATTHYTAIIDQMTLGTRWLNDTFGKCARPRIGWQIDPFGHSREQAWLFSQMGFDGLFLGRIHYEEKEWREKHKEMEFVWNTSPQLKDKRSLFTGVLPNVYWPPKGFCFDVYCADEPVDTENGIQRADEFLEIMEKQAKFFRTNHTVVTMGMDFHYKDASKWFRSLDNLIRFINEKDQHGVKYHALYSTPSCYLKALHESSTSWSLFNQDFFPYADAPHAYWTGYFTSRPNFKFFSRQANGLLQACQQMNVVGKVLSKDTLKLAKALGVIQHHDGISGTEKQHVVQDYIIRAMKGINKCQDIFRKGITNLLWSGTEKPLPLEFCPLLNISQCAITETANEVYVFAYNPLAFEARTYLRLPVTGSGYQIVSLPKTTIDAQIVPVPEKVTLIPERNSRATKELVFLATLPPLGVSTFLVKKYRNLEPHNSEESAITGDNFIENGVYRLEVNPTTGLLERVILAGGETVPLKQSFFVYDAYQGMYSEKPSGAYAFNPANDSPHPMGQHVAFKIVKGPLVEEIHQKYSNWITQVIRLYRNESLVEFDWVIGPIPISDARGSYQGKEVVSRFHTHIENDGVFYTDSNGRQTIKRIRNVRHPWTVNITEATASNYYPVVSWIYIKDQQKDLQMSVFPDRAQGGSSLQDGTLELMCHRRLLYDDGFGVEEPLNEVGVDGNGLIAKGKHYLFIGPVGDAEMLLRPVSNALVYTPQLAFLSTDDNYKGALRHTKSSGIKEPLPNNVNLLSLEAISEDEFLIRVEHIFPNVANEEFAAPANISLKHLLSGFDITDAKETILSGNEYKSNVTPWTWQTKNLRKRFLNGNISNDVNAEGRADSEDKTIIVDPGSISTFLVTVKRHSTS